MKKTLSLLVLLVTIFSFATGGRALAQTAEDVTKGSPSDAYVFPIQPGSDAWRAFMQHTDMVAATQVPLKTLQSMSTEGLIETVLSYPLRIDMLLRMDLKLSQYSLMVFPSCLDDLMQEQNS